MNVQQYRHRTQLEPITQLDFPYATSPAGLRFHRFIAIAYAALPLRTCHTSTGAIGTGVRRRGLKY